VTGRKRGVIKLQGNATVEGELACSAEITCMEKAL
jgi:3-hydroxymyristoyl/3-hydroxydecanoyl-(acyl carrier protein) dehydratase